MLKRYFVTPFAGISGASLFLRLILGIVFFAHGSQKVLGIFGGAGLAATAGFMAKLGVPPLLAYVSSFTEFLGGILILAGLATRIWAAGLVVNMAVAIMLAHLPKGFFAPTGFEYPLTLLFVAFTVVFLGPGHYSVDAILSERSAKAAVESRTHKHAA